MIPVRRNARPWWPYVAIGLGALVFAVALALWLWPHPGGIAERYLFEREEPEAWPGEIDCAGVGQASRAATKAEQVKAVKCADSATRYREEADARWQAYRAAQAAENTALWTRQQAAIGAINASFLFLALVASGMAARAAIATLRHEQESAEKELRAYVHAVSYVSTFPDEKIFTLIPTSPVFVQIGWQNLGDTPAVRCTADTNFKYFDGEIPADFDFPDRAVAADQEHFSMGRSQWMYSEQMQTTAGELAATTTGQRRLYVWGWIDYDDLFSRTTRRRTEFCVQGLLGFEKNGQRSIVFKAYPRHSGMDGDCMRGPRPWIGKT